MDAFRNIHLFVEVATAGGFRAAAIKLDMPNSTLSRRIAELEKELGLRLLNRTTRKVELTEAGQLYFDRCKKIIEEAKLAQEELAGMLTQPTGLIRASVPVDFTILYLSDIIAQFLKTYPGLSLELDVTPRQSDLITEQVDLAIRIGHPKEQHLIARQLGHTQLALYASPEFIKTFGEPKTPQDLIRFNCLRISKQALKLVHQKTQKIEIIHTNSSVVANNIGLLRKLAIQGVGIVALSSELIKDEIKAGQLVRVLKEWHPPIVPFYALTETRLIPAKVRVFIDFLIMHLSKNKDILGGKK